MVHIHHQSLKIRKTLPTVIWKWVEKSHKAQGHCDSRWEFQWVDLFHWNKSMKWLCGIDPFPRPHLYMLKQEEHGYCVDYNAPFICSVVGTVWHRVNAVFFFFSFLVKSLSWQMSVASLINETPINLSVTVLAHVAPLRLFLPVGHWVYLCFLEMLHSSSKASSTC